MKKRLGILLCVTALAACASKEATPPENPSGSAEAWSGGSETSSARPLEEPSDEARSSDPATSEASSRAGPIEDATRRQGPRDAVAAVAPAGGAAGSTAPPARADADNTRVNERDRDSSRKTPFDQGNNMPDLEITQKIRQAVMADGGLSFTAKNVKIITAGGKVTLRGPVNSAEERSKIEAAARRIAGDANVVNEIEIKS